MTTTSNHSSDKAGGAMGPQPLAKIPGTEHASANPPIDEAADKFFSSAESDSPEAPSDIDPELAELPASPRRRRRHPLVGVLVIGMSLYLMYFVKDDFLFYFKPHQPVKLGEAAIALKEGKLKANTYVELSGAPDRKHSLIVEGRFGGYDAFFRLLETNSQVFVQQHRETRNTDTVVTATHIGQLVHFASLPYHQRLQAYFEKTMTAAHDLTFAEVARVKATAGDKVIARDQKGEAVELTPNSMIWINVAFPNEWLVQFSKTHYAKIEEAQERLTGLSLPTAVDDETSASFWRIVVWAEAEEVLRLMAHFKDPALHASVMRRQVSYSARWDQLSIQGQTLVIKAADSTASTRYQKASGSSASGKEKVSSLVPVREEVIEAPAESILYLTASAPFKISPQAFVLLANKEPGQNWYYVLLYLVLSTFIIINGVILVSRWREWAAQRK